MNAGSFTLFASALLVAGASLAGAQTPPPVVPPPPPPMPSAPAALTVPNPFAGLVPGPRDLYQLPGGGDRFQQLPHTPQPPVFVGGGYFPWPYYPDPNYMPGFDPNYVRRTPQIVDARGGLVLETIPASAQVFIDGYYVGLAGEFGSQGRPMNITAGAHRIELRAQGYEALSFSVMIEPNEILRYRGDMRLVQAGPPVVFTPSQPAAAKSYYVIPKCYAGDKPPRGALPPGCDRKNLQTYK